MLQQLDLLLLMASAVWIQIIALAMPTLLVVNLKRASGDITKILGTGITSTDLTLLWVCLGMTPL